MHIRFQIQDMRPICNHKLTNTCTAYATVYRKLSLVRVQYDVRTYYVHRQHSMQSAINPIGSDPGHEVHALPMKLYLVHTGKVFLVRVQYRKPLATADLGLSQPVRYQELQ